MMLVACESPAEPPPDAAFTTGRLGMNDVTMLLPLPATTSTPTLLAMADGGDLVPRSLFTRVVSTPGDVLDPYEAFHVVAVRFDLCDRTQAGPCPAGADGRVRLVFQPMLPGMGRTQAADVALHAFFPIPAADLASVIGELRELAAIGGTDPASPLAVSTAITRPAYVTQLRALVLRYASATKLTRLTLFAQKAISASLNWAFRGVELRGTVYVDMMIPSIDVAQQVAILVGAVPSYEVTPVADSPLGMTLALDGRLFTAAAAGPQRQAVGALAEALNPTLQGADTEQCVGCHVSTFLLAHRAQIAGIDAATLPELFTSTYDLSIARGMSATNDRSLRALGWLLDKPAISQRVANDTAQVLTEIDKGEY